MAALMGEGQTPRAAIVLEEADVMLTP